MRDSINPDQSSLVLTLFLRQDLATVSVLSGSSNASESTVTAALKINLSPSFIARLSNFVCGGANWSSKKTKVADEGHDEAVEGEEEETKEDDEVMEDADEPSPAQHDGDDDVEMASARDSELEAEVDAEEVHEVQEGMTGRSKAARNKKLHAGGVGELPDPRSIPPPPPAVEDVPAPVPGLRRGTPLQLDVINTSTHKTKWNRLERFVTGTAFPHMRGLFGGSKIGNADACEAAVILMRKSSNTNDKNKELLKISEMVKRGYSEKQIERIVTTQAGVPDEDVPDMVSENYYWVTTERTALEREESSTTGTFTAHTAATPGVVSALGGSIAPSITPAVPLAPGVSNDLLGHIQSSTSIKKELKACNCYVDLPSGHELRTALEKVSNDLTAILDEIRDCTDMPSLEKLKEQAAELVDGAKYTRVQAAAVARELKKESGSAYASDDRLQDQLDRELLDAVGSGDLTVHALIDYGYLDMLVDYEQLDDFWDNFLKDYPLHPVARQRVCWKCMATKGNAEGADLGFCYTNLQANAKWKSSYGLNDPYDVRPPFLDLPGFSMSMVWPYILHIFHLGCGRDLIASALRVLLGKRYMFNGRTVALRIRDASRRLLDFAKDNGYTLSIRRLTPLNMGFQKKGYPEMMCKGYDTFVILRWLVSEVTCHAPPDQELLSTCLWAADSCLCVANAAGRNMTEAEHLHVRTVGHLFLTSYLNLAKNALASRRKLWRIRPKFHLQYHLFCDVLPSRESFTYHATWMDEDYNKHVVKIKKGTHKKTATVSTLKRWILGLARQLENAKTVKSR
ncbi:unnamed protein product [Symbiodinium sp. CCMP2592]|nr:unnamed protein product [Symbiodinium sp. CCMP2592]